MMTAVIVIVGVLFAGPFILKIKTTGGSLAGQKFNDGDYTGTSTALFWFAATARVTLKNGRVYKITVLNHRATKSMTEVNQKIPARIIERQSTRVDAVSGATYSSRILMNAVDRALLAARPSIR